jgi:hypothetical protein
MGRRRSHRQYRREFSRFVWQQLFGERVKIPKSDSNRLCNAIALILLEKAPASIDQLLPDGATLA